MAADGIATGGIATGGIATDGMAADGMAADGMSTVAIPSALDAPLAGKLAPRSPSVAINAANVVSAVVRPICGMRCRAMRASSSAVTSEAYRVVSTEALSQKR